VRKKITDLGPVRLSEVESAQQGIVNIIRSLEDDGEIFIARAGDDELVE